MQQSHGAALAPTRGPLSVRLAVAVLAATLAPRVTVASLLRREAKDVPKKDAKIKNPLETSVGDLVPNSAPPKPKGQQYNHMYVPVSPPARRDMSPTDPYETISGWEGAVAEVFDHMSPGEGRKFEGATCKSVCGACSIWAAQQAEGSCYCYATCKMGECSNTPHIGWSNDVVSSPRVEWQAKCNVGRKNCEAQCNEKGFNKEIAKCKKDKGNPTECFNRLSQLHQPVPRDARRQVHWCTHEHMSTCDSFMNVPTDPHWNCYKVEETCKEKARRGFRLPRAGWEPPSVWESVKPVR